MTDQFIGELSSYIQSTNKRYKDHFATLTRWIDRAKNANMVNTNKQFSANDQKIQTHEYSHDYLTNLISDIDSVQF